MGMLLLSGCTTTTHKSFDPTNINNAYRVQHDNLYLCVDGNMKKSEPVTSHTIIMPLSLKGITPVDKAGVYIPPLYFFDEKEILFYELDYKWLTSGCLTEDDKTKMREVSIVTDLVLQKDRTYYESFEYEEERKREIELSMQYLDKMKPVNGNGAVYLIQSSLDGNIYSLMYVDPEPRFNGVNKLNFTVSWSETGFSLSQTVIAPVVVPVSLFLYTIHNTLGP